MNKLEQAVRNLVCCAEKPNPTEDDELAIPLLISAVVKLGSPRVAVVAEEAGQWFAGATQTCGECHPRLMGYRFDKFMKLVGSLPALLAQETKAA